MPPKDDLTEIAHEMSEWQMTADKSDLRQGLSHSPTHRGSARLALRTQQLLAHESGIGDTVDPLAGSYCIEALTDSIEKEAVEYIAKIGAMGGAAAAIQNGYMQREMANGAYRHNGR
jgi:methylmalonyl-CoA mutase N-terminal domain/subunit